MKTRTLTSAFLCARICEPENWLPNSPDLNPVDYSVWKALQQLVYCNRRI